MLQQHATNHNDLGIGFQMGFFGGDKHSLQKRKGTKKEHKDVKGTSRHSTFREIDVLNESVGH